MELSRGTRESHSVTVSSEDKPLWEATSEQNLVRYRPAGTYFARFRVNGKPLWKSLETTVFSVAKQRLPETIREHRAKLESVAAVTIGKMTVGDAARVYLDELLD